MSVPASGPLVVSDRIQAQLDWRKLGRGLAHTVGLAAGTAWPRGRPVPSELGSGVSASWGGSNPPGGGCAAAGPDFPSPCLQVLREKGDFHRSVRGSLSSGPERSGVCVPPSWWPGDVCLPACPGVLPGKREVCRQHGHHLPVTVCGEGGVCRRAGVSGHEPGSSQLGRWRPHGRPRGPSMPPPFLP